MFKVEKFLRNLIDNVLSKLLYFFVFFVDLCAAKT